jgi:hypothetical protein
MFKQGILVIICLTTAAVVSVGTQASAVNGDILGRWDITVQDANGEQYPSWFEATIENGKLAGRFVGRVGSQRPIRTIEFTNGHLGFSLPIQYEPNKSDLKFEANLTGDRLEGTTTDALGRTLKWTAVRAAKLARGAAPKWGKAITLFNGHDLTGWKVRDASKDGTWRVTDGIMENTPHGTDIVSEKKFRDFKLHVEFKMVPLSNSGVYLRGRYEVQIQDDYGKEPESHRIGGIYGFVTPSSNPAKKAGEWQTYDITFVGRRVTVIFNGTTIIDNAEIPGITGGALDSNEGGRGPIMLQGDHQKIYYRSVVITPAK